MVETLEHLNTVGDEELVNPVPEHEFRMRWNSASLTHAERICAPVHDRNKKRKLPSADETLSLSANTAIVRS